LREAANDDVVPVFILPPTAEDLEQRLNVRAQDPPETVRRRMLGASNEIQHWKDYDYVVVNYDVLQSLSALRAILAAERLRRTRLTGLEDFVQSLQSEL
jgi:guanylate kinase